MILLLLTNNKNWDSLPPVGVFLVYPYLEDGAKLR